MAWYQNPFLQVHRKYLSAMTCFHCLYAGLCKSSTLQKLPAALIYAPVGKLCPVLYIVSLAPSHTHGLAWYLWLQHQNCAVAIGTIQLLSIKYLLFGHFRSLNVNPKNLRDAHSKNIAPAFGYLPVSLHNLKHNLEQFIQCVPTKFGPDVSTIQ